MTIVTVHFGNSLKRTRNNARISETWRKYILRILLALSVGGHITTMDISKPHPTPFVDRAYREQ
jgi:hypothetical protein